MPEPPRPPEGWRVERDSEREFSLTAREILFHVVYTAGKDEPVTTVRVGFSRRDGWWYVHPGSMASRMEGDEARARAAAFFEAGVECERRNAAIAKLADLSERDRWLLQRVYSQSSAGAAWTSADAVAPSAVFGRHAADVPEAVRGLSAQGAGQILARLAREGHCEYEPGAFGRYRRREPVE